MNPIEYMSSKIGLAFFHFIQSGMFLLMVYILASEYFRTKREDLVYKLVACGSISVINIITTVILSVEFFNKIILSEKYFPLIFNIIFAIIVLALARAFIYDFVNDKKKFSRFIHLCMIVVFLFYIVLQIYWLTIFREGMIFAYSNLQFVFGLFFLFVLLISIYYTMKFRKSYGLRIIIAFSAIVIVQIINMYISVVDHFNPLLNIVKSSIPVLVPMMFASVVFKELIESVVTMVDQLKRVLDLQGDLVKELMKIGSDLSKMSDELVKTSIDGWQKLSSVVENIYKQEETSDDIIKLIEKSIFGISDIKDNVNMRNFENKKIGDFSFNYESLNGENKNVYIAIDTVLKMNDESDEIFNTTSGIVHKLGQSIEDISATLKEIEDISSRTSMLSLNASIEASRAGESGMGFAVVAEGVGKLADLSQQNSDNVARQLNDIIIGIDDLNSSIARVIGNIKNSGKEMAKIKKYFNDSISFSKLYEWIISTNRKLNTEHIENCSLLSIGMRKTEELLEENKVHGIQMKDSISRHISEIEAIAGMSDSLNDMINNLNTKTDHVINMLVEIRNITK